MGEDKRSRNQKIFWDMTLGILVYAVVLGFFEDYTKIISTWSYSTTFFVAVVMQFLTYATLWLKTQVVKKSKGREEKKYMAFLVFGVWGIMFVSKFVFLAVIDIIFGNSVEVSGFIGILIIIVAMSSIKKLIDIIYLKLA